MKYLSYNHLYQAVVEQAEAGELDSAIQHFLDTAPQFPQRFERMTFYYHARLLGKAGRVDEALDVLRIAQKLGHWYPQNWLPETDEGLAPLYAHSNFAEWLTENNNLTQEAIDEVVLELYVLPPANESNTHTPLLIALHGNYSNAFETQDVWEIATESDVMLAVPQSSQIEGKNAYVWNDFEMAEAELKAHYEALQAESNFDAKQVVLGGFSMGGGFAAFAALNNIIPVQGVLLVAPYIPDVEGLLPLLDNPEIQHLKFVIIIGKQDTGCLPNAEALHKVLNERGFTCRYDLRDQYAHTYPSDFDKTLENALKFILT